MARKPNFPLHLFTFVFTLIINPFMSINGDQNPTWPNFLHYDQLLSQNISSKIIIDKSSVEFASYDFGNLIHKSPAAVFFPSSVQDIASLIHLSYNHSMPFNVAARGRGHSCRGQAMVENGVVINMPSLGTNTMSKNNYDHYNIYNNNNKNNNNRIRVFYEGSLGFYYADVGGEQLWIDVLKVTLEYGVIPVSWTDYLYLSVGGTLSNAGISGQAFRYGPQINNVLELDVVTGRIAAKSFIEENQKLHSMGTKAIAHVCRTIVISCNEDGMLALLAVAKTKATRNAVCGQTLEQIRGRHIWCCTIAGFIWGGCWCCFKAVAIIRSNKKSLIYCDSNILFSSTSGAGNGGTTAS